MSDSGPTTPLQNLYELTMPERRYLRNEKMLSQVSVSPEIKIRMETDVV